MTETIEYTDDEKRELDRRVHDARAVADLELSDFLNWMFGLDGERDKVEFSMTLALPSGVIGGTVISRQAWTERQDEILLEGGAETLVEARREVAANVELVRKEVRATREAEGRPLPPHRFVHLKNAELKSNGATFNLRNVRVNLAHVAAWELGSWTTLNADA